MDELSEAFRRAVAQAFPNWEHLIEATAGFVEVEVPQKGTDRCLHLSTADNEITISFDYWHTHVGPFLGIDTAESVETAIGIIRSFLAEETVVKIARRGGAWVESSLEYLVAPSPPKEDCETQVLSWRGTHDQTIETA